MNGKDWQDLIEQTQRLDGVPVSEWLSAYYDGELSAGERLRVEAWLDQHPGARALLGQFSELSTLVGQAGALSPRELENVGEHRLPDRILSRLTPPAAVTPSAAGGGTGRAWTRWGVALISVAASLGLVVVLIPPDRKQNVHVAAGNISATPAPLPAGSERLDAAAAGMDSPVAREIHKANSGDETSIEDAVARPLAGSAGPRSGAPAQPFSDPSPATAAGGATSGARSRPPSGAAPAAPVPVPSAPGASQAPFAPVASSMPILAPGTHVDPGEIIHHLATLGDEAVVIEYTVVDVRKTAGELEVLLRKQGIQSVTQARRSGPEKAEAAPMFAIYVEADDRQLAAALKEFRTLPTSIDLLDPLSDLKKADEAGTKPAPGDASGSGPAKDQGGPKRPEEKGMEKGAGQVGGKAGDKGNGSPGQAPQKSISPSGASEGEPEPREQIAYQMPFPLSPEQASQLPRRNQQVRQQQGYGEFAQQRAADQKRVAGENASRVLIVLQALPPEAM